MAGPLGPRDQGDPFTSVIVDILRGEHQTDEHRAKNPLTHVPALGIDGRCKLPLDTHTTKRLSSSQQTLDASE
jgi:hypothetical protein